MQKYIWNQYSIITRIELEPRIILKLFLNFSQYSYKLHSYKKESTWSLYRS